MYKQLTHSYPTYSRPTNCQFKLDHLLVINCIGRRPLLKTKQKAVFLALLRRDKDEVNLN